MKGFILLIMLLTSSKIVIGQKSDTGIAVKPIVPISVEVQAGNQGLYYQMIINKRLSSESRFGFFNITLFRGDYNNELQRNQFYSLPLLTANIWKGIALTGGAVIISVSGFRPTTGVRYSFSSKKVNFVLAFRVDLTQTHNIEPFSLVEYKSRLTQKLGLYTRVQTLYNYNMEFNNHARSYVYLRLGLSYKNFQFGFGTNIDYYGPQKIHENSYGGFVRTTLF